MLAGHMNENHLFIAGSNMMSQNQYMQFIEILMQKVLKWYDSKF